MQVLQAAASAARARRYVAEDLLRRRRTVVGDTGATEPATSTTESPRVALERDLVGGGDASATTVEVNVSATPTWTGRFTITDGDITATSKVMCWQAPGPYTGKGTLPGDEVLDRVEVVSVVPSDGSAQVTWQTPAVFATREIIGTGGGPKPNVQTQVGIAQVPEQMFRRGLVKGNIKFHYITFA